MTPEQLQAFSEQLTRIRRDLLCVVNRQGPLSEQYTVLALNAMDDAERFLQLAKIYTMRGD